MSLINRALWFTLSKALERSIVQKLTVEPPDVACLINNIMIRWSNLPKEDVKDMPIIGLF